MAIELASAYVSLSVATDKIPKQINNALNGAGSSSAADKAGASIGARLSDAMGTAVKAGAVAAGAAAAGFIGTALSKGFQRLTAIDDAQSKLEGLGHTALSQSRIMDSALASVRGTSYGLGEAATIAASAVAAGIKPGQDLTKYLSLTADAATIAGTSLNEMGAIINKVQTKGKAYTLDLNQLAIRGIPIYQWLAEEMNVSQEALSDMVAEGKVDSATYLKVIEQNIGGAATAGNAVSAAWANTMAAMGRLGEAALKPTFGRTADWLKGAIVAIDSMTARVKPLAQALDHKVFNQWAPKLAEGSEKASEAFERLRASSEVQDALSRTSALFESLWSTGEKLWPAVKSIGQSFSEASAAVGVSSWRIVLSALEAVAQVADAILVPALNGVAAVAEKTKPLISALALAFFAFKTVPAIMGAVVPSIAKLQGTVAAAGAGATAASAGLSRYQAAILGVHNGVTRARGGLSGFHSEVRSTQAWASAAGRPVNYLSASYLTLADRVGGAAGVMGKFKSAAAGVTSALGGPVGIALMAAVGGYMAISSEVRKASRQQDLMTHSTEGLVEAQHSLRKALNNSAGAMSDDAVSAFEERTREALRIQSELAETGPGILAKATAGWATLFNNWDGATNFADSVKQQEAVARAGEQVTGVFKSLEISNEELATGIRGTNTEYQSLRGQIDGTTTAGRQTLSWLTTQRTEFLNTQAAVKNLTPGYLSIADAFKTLADEGKTAAQQSSALFGMLQQIAGINPDLKTAVDNQNRVLREALQAAPIDQERGASSELLDGDGRVSTVTENGQELSNQLDAITKAATDSATAGRDLDEAFGSAGASFEATAKQFGLDVDEIRRAAELQGYNEGVIRISAVLEGADDVTAGVGKVWTSLQSLNPNEPKVVTVDSDIDPKALDELRGLGAEIKEITAENGETQFEIDLKDEDARKKLAEFVANAARVAEFKAEAEIDADTTKFDLKAEETSALVDALTALEALPDVDLDLTPFEGNQAVTLEALAALSDQVANPEVLLDIAKALADAKNVEAELDRIAQKKRIAEIQARIVETPALYSAQGWADALSGRPIERAEGGSVNGLGGPTSDSIPAMLSAGEHVLTAAEVEAAGGQGAIYRMREMIRAGALRFNEGGAVGGIQAALQAGRSVTGNKYDWGGTGPLNFDCSGFVGWLQQIAMGLSAAAAAGKRLYTTHDFFGAGSSGFAGLLPGLGPAGTQFQVGVSQEHMSATIAGQPAESGGSHGTSRIGAPAVGATDSQYTKWFHLPNEMVAGGVSNYRGSRGSRNRKEAPEWTESDQLDLDSAHLSVIEAKESRDKLDTKKDVTETDRQQANIAIRRAELRVIELQQKKDEALNWIPEGPAPEAPTIAEAFEKEERERLRAQIAVDDARLDRNEVYADPEATDNERLEADLALMDAEERLAELSSGKKGDGEKLDYSLRGTMKRFGGRLVDAVIDGVFGQMPDQIASSRWLNTDWGSLIPEEVDGEGSGWLFDSNDPIGNANPSKKDVDSQLPVTPGEKGWLRSLLDAADEETLKKSGVVDRFPFISDVLQAGEDAIAPKDFADGLDHNRLRRRGPKVFDRGGWLEPGEMAINLSERPEPIFNSPDQLQKFMGGGLKPMEQVQPIDMSVHFHGSVATRDDEELIRKIRWEQKRQVAPHTRR